MDGALVASEPTAQDVLSLTEDIREVQTELTELHLHVVEEVVVVFDEPRITALSDFALATWRSVLEHEGREQADHARDDVRVEDVNFLEHPVGIDGVASVADLLVLDVQVVRVEDGHQVSQERREDAHYSGMILHV